MRQRTVAEKRIYIDTLCCIIKYAIESLRIGKSQKIKVARNYVFFQHVVHITLGRPGRNVRVRTSSENHEI